MRNIRSRQCQTSEECKEFDHSAQKSNQAYGKRWNEDSSEINLRDDRKRRSHDYHKANQCYDLSVWYGNGVLYESEKRYDNRVCYSCGYQGHIAVNYQSQWFETRRCFQCQIKGHIAKDCPMRSKERSRAKSQKMEKKSVSVKFKKQKVQELKVQEQKVQEKKIKLSQVQKDKLRKKRKKARKCLERILSSDKTSTSDKSSDKSSCSPKNDKSSKTNSSDTTEDRLEY
ncbi:putative transcription factor interactor and regulator CCHC(Zn) family [Helianthus debilis subsp. tardiflorus]